MKNRIRCIRIYKQFAMCTSCQIARQDGSYATYSAERPQELRRQRIMRIANTHPHKVYITPTMLELTIEFPKGGDVQ